MPSQLNVPPHPTRATIPSLDFTPDEKLAACILADLHSPHCSLGDIAARAKTSVEALNLWLAKPEIADRLDSIESIFARRARLQLADNTGAIMIACNQVISTYTKSESTHLFDTNNLRAHAIMTRKASNALLASRILLHLAKHFTSAPSPRPPRPERASPSPLPTPQAPHHDPELDPATIPTKHEPRFIVLPALKFTPLTIHGTATNPTHENGALQNPRGDAGATGATQNKATPAPHSHPQAEGLTINSRGVERAHASDTPGKPTQEPPHPDGVLVAPEPRSTIYKPPSTNCGCNDNPNHPCTRNCRRGHRAREPTPT